MGFRATSRIDKIFDVGIHLKALDGLLEAAGGILLFLVKSGYQNLDPPTRYSRVSEYVSDQVFLMTP